MYMANKKTHDEFVDEVFDLCGLEYIVMNRYVDSRTKVLIRHNICKTEFLVRPDSFLMGSRCPKCNTDKRTKKHEDFIAKLDTLFPNKKYTVLEKYVNTRTKIRIKHNECGTEFMASPKDLLQKKAGCPECKYNKPKPRRNFDTYSFKKEVDRLTNNSYLVLSPYTNTTTKILIKHKECGNVYEVRPNDFLQGRRCPKCCRKKIKDT